MENTDRKRNEQNTTYQSCKNKHKCYGEVEGYDNELGNIIDIKNNHKAKSSKGYEHWATKHNLQTAASTLVEIRNKGFNSMEEIERGISGLSIEMNELKRQFDKLSWEQKKDKESGKAYSNLYEQKRTL